MARRYTQRLGDQLYAEGYRGYFDVDYLIDEATGELYLGELNPRICGASPLTNHGAFARADAPLFLFHLLEFCGVDFDLDVDEINEPLGRASVHRQLEPDRPEKREPGRRHPRPDTGLRIVAPEAGGQRRVRAASTTIAARSRPRTTACSCASWRRGIAGMRARTSGILITRGRSMTDDFTLNDRARQWVRGLGEQYASHPLHGGSCRRSVGDCKVQ